MAIQRMGIRATCDRCGEIAVAGTERDLAERVGWRVTQTRGKGKESYCSMACEQEHLAERLSPNQTSLEDALNGAESQATDLPNAPEAAQGPEQSETAPEAASDIPAAFRDWDDRAESEPEASPDEPAPEQEPVEDEPTAEDDTDDQNPPRRRGRR